MGKCHLSRQSRLSVVRVFMYMGVCSLVGVWVCGCMGE